MEWSERYEQLLQSQKETFKRICRKLLKSTFIVRERSDQREDYNFIRRDRNRDIFSGYFQIMGYDVIVDETAGVAMLRNFRVGDDEAVASNRLRLRLCESVVLCCLWFLYAEKMVSGSLTSSVIIEKSQLDMQLNRLGYGNKIDKESMKKTLKLLSNFNLIEVIGKIDDYECKIRGFTSMQFCLSDDDFKRFAEITIPKMKSRSCNLEDEIGKMNEENDDEYEFS